MIQKITDQGLDILILDDESVVCKRLKSGLEKNGYRIEIFSNSPQALKRLEEKSFDIVITDLKMEEVDGEQILERVKERSPTTEVIIITGYATMEYAYRCLEKGAFDFVAKPFKLEDLRKAIGKVRSKIANA
jgi:DNA-binding NtrC family response regulator